MNGIGLFGGTFNPIHLGHLKVARAVCDGFCLDTVYFIPCAQPPHKGTENLADAGDRLSMLKAAVAGKARFVVSDMEIRRQGLSYSIDTVVAFKKKMPLARPCFLMLGIDAFLEFHTWKTYEIFFDVIPMIIMTRPAESPAFSRETAGAVALKTYIQTRIDSGYEYVPEKDCYVHPQKQPLYLYHVPPVPISATGIRARIRRGESISGLVPPAVENYILKKGLYV